MISIETALAMFADMAMKAETDPGIVIRLMANFASEEPNMAALVGSMFGKLELGDNTSAALTAIAYYRELEKRQKESDKLSEEMG